MKNIVVSVKPSDDFEGVVVLESKDVSYKVHLKLSKDSEKVVVVPIPE